MRVFIQCVDSFVGKGVVKELRRNGETFHRLFGSLKDPKAEKPKIVKRLVHRQDEKPRIRYAATLLSCRVIVVNMFCEEYEELEFVLSALAKAENPVTVVLISSLFVWSQANGISEADYERREPRSSALKKWKEYEERFLAFNVDPESQVKAHIVAAGAFYGCGETHYFSNTFRDAWHGRKVRVELAGNSQILI